MLLYRIAEEQFARDLSGAGARLYGGRWNPKGVPMLYTAESVALAALEVLVRLSTPKRYSRIVYGEPDDASLEIMTVQSLPPSGSFRTPTHPSWRSAAGGRGRDVPSS